MYLWATALALGSAIAAFAGIRVGVMVGLAVAIVAVVVTRNPRGAEH